MNPSISHVSLCIFAERKHDRLQLGTSLNKSVERLSPKPAGSPRETGKVVEECKSLCLLMENTWMYYKLNSFYMYRLLH